MNAKSQKPRIVGINGSPRKGHVYSLLRRSLDSAGAVGAKTQLVNLGFGLIMIGSAVKKIVKADGIIFATPVYWFNCSAAMKRLIDVMSVFADSPFVLEGKVVAFLSGCNEDGGQQAINSMAIPLNHMGAIILPFGFVFHNRNMVGRSENNWQESDIDSLGRRMVEFIEEYGTNIPMATIRHLEKEKQ